ncbi:unnamed protein product [Arabis nemorensis]|uniref:Uncharacterized protein n=1 Tax=Arabis nemorensis TaxID=586526 RepID=A0A565BVL9_9BRAS|nr:unnamed protein product [Arabis nemorensis]
MNQYYQNPFRIYEISFNFCTSLLLCLSLTSAQAVAGGGHSWDGIVVTQANYQALQAIKHDLIDFTGTTLPPLVFALAAGLESDASERD